MHMTDKLTLREAAVLLGVSRINTVRELLDLDTDDGKKAACAGYDASGRLLVRADAVQRKVEERAVRAPWRAENLKHWAQRSPRTADGKGRLCLRDGCGAKVMGRDRFCRRHSTKPSR